MGDKVELQPPHPEIGDELTLVVVHPNTDTGRDPVAKINGVSCYIRMPDGSDAPAFGEAVRCRIADVEESHYLAVPAHPDDHGGAA